jgi:hypothetical protein
MVVATPSLPYSLSQRSMNSPNQPTRQYHHNTCELSIEDKKSPFPAWMNFNKPNPLKFSLSLQDPDRPEQPPIGISGDRLKLDSLHQTVDEYVNQLLAKAPLPLLQGSNIEKTSALASGALTADESASLERPIDALKMTGDQPHLEADGPSRHLLYLGNMAADGQVMASLSTLQLFDLSSTLEEATQPLAVTTSTAEPSAALGSISEPNVIEPIEPVVSAIAPPAPPVVIPAEPLAVQKFETSVEEPRVLLPSVKEPMDSDKLESESSFFARSSTADNTDRFKSPKPSLGSLNLPELPDFSNSPLTSIWLWLGLGTVATGILAFPFLSKSFNENLASKPAVQSSPKASTDTNIATGVPSYQPSSPTTPSGITNSPSPSVLPTPSLSATGSPVIVSPQLTYGNGASYGANSSLSNGSIPGQLSTKKGGGATTPGTANSGSRSTSTDLVTATNGVGTQQRSRSSTTNQSGANSWKKPSDIVSQSGRNAARSGNTNTAQSSGNGGLITDLNGNSEFEQKTQAQDPISSATRGSSNNRQTKPSSSSNRGRSTTNATPDGSVVAQGQELTEGSFGNSSSNDLPVTTPPKDNSPTLTAPSGSQLGNSPQVDSTRQYIQSRWKADPSFSESLQYVMRVGKNGKVVSIQGQSVASREYLSRTNFIKPGTQIAGSSSSGQDQSIQVILRPDGSTEAIGNP